MGNEHEPPEGGQGPLWQRVEALTHCDHPLSEPRLRVLSNGVEHVWLQCLECGEGLRAVPKREFGPAELSQLKAFDDTLREYHDVRRRVLWERLRLEEREQQQAARRADYDDYILHSPDWRARSRRVLERDAYRCRAVLDGCLGHATQAHHTTYAHFGREPLFELVAVCRACHAQLHDHDDDDATAEQTT